MRQALKRFLPLAVMALAVGLPQAALASRIYGLDARPDAFDREQADPLVRRIQDGLARAGYYLGRLHGVMTPETADAIKEYQRRSGLAVNGRPSENLAVRLETGSRVGTLLRRLEQALIDGIAKARKALLSDPRTRALIESAPADAPARAAVDAAGCLNEPTPRCLLGAALQSVTSVSRGDMRDWALGEILVTQTRAGFAADALATVRRIGDPRLIIVALRDIAAARAEQGDVAAAQAAAEIIPDARHRAESLATIAQVFARGGHGEAALESVQRLILTLPMLKDPVRKVAFRSRVALVLHDMGESAMARYHLDIAEREARASGRTGVALRYVASALAHTGRAADPLAVLGDVTDQNDRMPVLIRTATEQARAGDALAALVTASSIEAERYRAVVLSSIAVEQGLAGAGDAARETLARAAEAAELITMPYARSFAKSRIADAFIKLGDGFADQALAAADAIDDDQLRAEALWRLAAEQGRAGGTAVAAEAQARAETASGAIKSRLSRLWMFGDLAEAHKRRGEDAAAWASFERALAVARTIDSPWTRARALARLAATLVALRQNP